MNLVLPNGRGVEIAKFDTCPDGNVLVWRKFYLSQRNRCA